ncbi:DNA damage-inducible transcript 4-like protein [Plakobranchus ocellatus]|uniref:DNA damage-inducible transcript 4-like protein n=1 Tax=Plakobranchus ocellatus TaxID=259542 RepID=A0AAV3Y7R5_9GAST|nr:DNA damage-inducible transcript 4-like protein [Plakobranchus ocellatus]
MLDVNSLTHRIKCLVKSLLDSSKSESSYSLIMEPDFSHEKPSSNSKLEKTDGKKNNYGSASFTNENGTDTSDLQLDLCPAQQAQVESSLRAACERELACRVVFSADLLSRVSEDILRMSVAEPCGVKGCAIILRLQEKEKIYKLATVFGGSITPPTFEIHVTLREDTRSWKTVQKMFLTIKGCLFNSQWKTAPKILHPAYQLEKRRLYRSMSGSLESNGYH